ncbi:metal ABC transporter solute-binding protein, Zn/Mn family, partial [Tetragenococcus koreensis]|uniref:metal ABC transporter solute-binding protein, Zn/Mn family n=2 Tax=Tetragenococcus koreensis TaxID=290335 RepID=UPI001F1A1C04
LVFVDYYSTGELTCFLFSETKKDASDFSPTSYIIEPDVPASYIWEINTEEEGTPEQTKRVVDQLEDTNVKSLFVETSVNPSPMQSVSQDSGIPIYSEIFTDSVAEPGEEGDSYYAMMKWNIDKIHEGLTQE